MKISEGTNNWNVGATFDLMSHETLFTQKKVMARIKLPATQGKISNGLRMHLSYQLYSSV